MQLLFQEYFLSLIIGIGETTEKIRIHQESRSSRRIQNVEKIYMNLLEILKMYIKK